MSALYPYQRQDAAVLATANALYYVGDTGVGKSCISLEAMRLAGGGKALILCPSVARLNWKHEAEKWAPELKVKAALNGNDLPGDADIFVVGYDSLSRKNSNMHHTLRAFDYDILICDEAHYLKTYGANRTKAVYGKKCDGIDSLTMRAKKTWLLSATPMPNSADELYPALRALYPRAIPKPGARRPMTKPEFEQWFCDIRTTRYGRQIRGSKNLDVLRKTTRGFFFRRRKSEVLKDLPPVTVSDVQLAGDVPKELLDEIELNLGARIDDADADTVLQVLQQQEAALSSLRRLTGMVKAPLAVDYLAMKLESGLDKVVVFGWHQDVLDKIVTGLGIYQPVLVSGKTRPVADAEAVKRFQTDPACRVFVGNIQAAGTAITLTAASYVVFVEASWTPSDNYQALSRCHRIGQRDGVIVEMLALPGSVDWQIARAVARKTADIAQVFG